jgi:hypothetical protein
MQVFPGGRLAGTWLGVNCEIADATLASVRTSEYLGSVGGFDLKFAMDSQAFKNLKSTALATCSWRGKFASRNATRYRGEY